MFLAGCQAGNQADSAGGSESNASDAPAVQEKPADLKTILAHHNWVIKTVDGQEFPSASPDANPRPKPNISFDQWPHLSGRICNSYSGQFEVKGDTLTARNVASTMMLCVDESLNRLEGTLHQMLNKGVKVEAKGRTLTLTGDGHELVFELFDYVQ